MDLISIIIPVYNVEAYLGQCLRSILEQTYENWELLLIDDGSTDQSSIICDEFAQQDCRIRVFHCSHTTVGQARNVGLDHCKGQYICFVDGDDYTTPDMLKFMHKILVKYDGDISVCRWSRCGTECSVARKYNEDNVIHIYDTVADFLFAIYDIYNIKDRNAVWGKLFRRALFRDIRFTNLLRASDTPIWPYLLHRARRVVQGNRICYYYRSRIGSVIHPAGFNESVFCNILSLRLTLKGVQCYFPEIIDKVKLFYYCTERNVLEEIYKYHRTRQYHDKIKEIQSEMRKSWPQIYKNNYISWPEKLSFFFVSCNLFLYMKLRTIYITLFQSRSRDF